MDLPDRDHDALASWVMLVRADALTAVVTVEAESALIRRPRMYDLDLLTASRTASPASIHRRAALALKRLVAARRAMRVTVTVTSPRPPSTVLETGPADCQVVALSRDHEGDAWRGQEVRRDGSLSLAVPIPLCLTDQA